MSNQNGFESIQLGRTEHCANREVSVTGSPLSLG